MKLLLDENLSYRLVSQLRDLYPGSDHVRNVGLRGAEDECIWAYAGEHGYIITSKDADFYQRSILRGAPPKVVWVRIGNAPTRAITELLRDRVDAIQSFAANEEATCLLLDRTP
jgi:predicted nuclease of predicted toxin-antitoxin system